MSALAIASVAFVCCFGAALAGMALHLRLPDRHLDGDSKDVVKLVMGLVATMAALVLGLLIASSKSLYDTQVTEMQHLSANLVQLDRMLDLYGPETREARNTLKQTVTVVYQQIWPSDDSRAASLDPSGIRGQADTFYEKLQSLSPSTEAQRRLLNAAWELATSVAQIRALMFEQLGGTVSWPLLMVLVSWVSVIFLGFGLFARFHVTIAITLLVGALSVASAIFLILELSRPYEGLMRISDVSVRSALARMDQ